MSQHTKPSDKELFRAAMESTFDKKRLLNYQRDRRIVGGVLFYSVLAWLAFVVLYLYLGVPGHEACLR